MHGLILWALLMLSTVDDAEKETRLLVQVVEGGRPVAGIVVAVIPEPDLDRAHELADLKERRVRAVTDERGWARLRGLPAGDVVLALWNGDERVPQLTDVYGIAAGRETVIAPLDFERPASLTLRVAMPEAAIAAGFRLQTATASAPRGGRWPARLSFHARTDASGSVTFDALPPGEWRIAGVGRLPSSQPIALRSSTVLLRGGEHAEVDVVADDVLFRGRVRDPEGDPAAGVVALEPLEVGRRGVVTELDAEGRFVALLERPGTYSLRLRDGRTVPEVSFDDPAEVVEIELPAAYIAGQVVDSGGRPVTHAVVRAESTHDGKGHVQSMQADTRTAADGTFRFESVAPGVWSLLAESDERRSERVTVDVDGGSRDGITLRLTDVQETVVVVQSPAGMPLAGALVYVTFPPRIPGDLGESVELRTDSNGLARIRTPAKGGQANFVVVAPDGTLAAFRRPVAARVELALPPATGAVRMTLRRADWRSRAHIFSRLVAPDGAAVGPCFTGVTSREVHVLPRVAAGRWRLVEGRTSADIHQILSGRGALLPALATFDVHPGVATEVSIDPSTESEP